MNFRTVLPLLMLSVNVSSVILNWGEPLGMISSFFADACVVLLVDHLTGGDR